MTRVALLARCDDRGIASITKEFFDHMRPAKTLVMEMRDPNFGEFPGRYANLDPGMEVQAACMNRSLTFPDPDQIDWLLTDVDVLFAHETVMDFDLVIGRARERGVRTVVQCNPEFYRHGREYAGKPHPDVWCWPTPWLTDTGWLAPGPLLPVPAPDRDWTAAPPSDGPLRVVHVAGHAAKGDRNGTVLFMQALAHIETEALVTVVGQDGWLPSASPSKTVTLETWERGYDDRFDLYRGQNVVVLPRRYGGLCLPAQEAMSRGCAVLMPGCSPNNYWPAQLMRAHNDGTELTPLGHVPRFRVNPEDIARSIDTLNRNRQLLEQAQSQSWEWAEANSWDVLRPWYEEVLGC